MTVLGPAACTSEFATSPLRAAARVAPAQARHEPREYVSRATFEACAPPRATVVGLCARRVRRSQRRRASRLQVVAEPRRPHVAAQYLRLCAPLADVVVRANFWRLAEIFRQLLHNAVRFSRPRDSVVARATPGGGRLPPERGTASRYFDLSSRWVSGSQRPSLRRERLRVRRRRQSSCHTWTGLSAVVFGYGSGSFAIAVVDARGSRKDENGRLAD